MHRLGATLVFALLLVCPGVVRAFPKLNVAFLEEYVNDNPNKEFVELVKKKAKCNVCHQGKNRKHRNPYGAHLADIIDMKKDGKDMVKLKAALRDVAKLHSVAGDDKSPTYGELIAEGKLPGGSLEDAMKEPEGEK